MPSVQETFWLLLMLEYIFVLFQTDVCIARSTAWCPPGRYPAENGRCHLCFENCGRLGCTGPGHFLGEGGCSSCWLGLQMSLSKTKCISPFVSCPSGYYRRVTSVNGSQVTMCRKCHSLCGRCSGPGVSYCDTCRFFRHEGMCVRECPAGAIVRPDGVTCLTLSNSRRRLVHFLPYRDRYRNVA